MCLRDVKKTKKKSGIGWKVITVDSDGICSTEYTGHELPTDKWIHCTNLIHSGVNWATTRYATYPIGFHLWMRKKDAVYWGWLSNRRLVKVEYRNATHVGRVGVKDHDNDNGKAIIASEIKIDSSKMYKWKKDIGEI